METQDRAPRPVVGDRLFAAPERFDFHQAVRLLGLLAAEAGGGADRTPGGALPIRIRSSGSAAFPVADVLGLARPGTDGDPRPTLTTDLVALVGAMGVLPAAYGDMVAAGFGREEGEAGLHGLLDLFHQRLTELYHGAWEKTAFAIREERGEVDGGLGACLLALSGLATGGIAGVLETDRDGLVQVATLRAFAGLLNRTVRSTDGFADLLTELLGVPVTVEPLWGRWRSIPREARCRLGAGGDQGFGAPLGERIYDHGSAVLASVGPVDAELAKALVEPARGGGPSALCRALGRLAAYFFGGAMEVRMVIALADGVAPDLALGTVREGGLSPRLGLTSWVEGPAGETATVLWLPV